ncbi:MULTISPECIES: DUF262 domain-containing protein [Nocardiopsis]|uniref:DUF262 domain-containing protein n=1 Tax=Nocardiopsis changdeensis TaxID=2831969 RepID=A0ABX8BRP3_9ACTN|nr:MULTISPECIES: DUF262 domain-containing protein [Nocardiopsis]QUX24905.1 DUF262 domain-containing protein [Nocardiopsis changdeensis]QYX35291.1 DUF262 domain-containing HNH endonuclease family protein [Nocardiopsis sp. MT53]
MQSNTYSPTAIFGSHTRYVVPLFQRPYVWNRDEQWEPLWQDVRSVAERLLEPQTLLAPPAPHFLGAVVLDQQSIPTGYIAVRRVIDGQQRLTTLQLLLDAVRRAVRSHGRSEDEPALRILVRNEAQIAGDASEIFKVWPTDRDRDGFRAAMGEDGVLGQGDSPLVRAHGFFFEEITRWALDDGEGAPGGSPQERLNALVRTVRDHLRLVVIDLEPGDNAQVIFETLNHRGSPLLAADLIKNLLFQVAEQQGADVERMYRDHWAPLDGDRWREEVSQGRRMRPRIDMFFQVWLTMRLRREVLQDRLFVEFRELLATGGTTAAALMEEVAADARVYQGMADAPYHSVEGLFHYRVVRALDTAVVAPLQLWLMRWDESDMPEEQRHLALGALESWIVRRSLCRATVKDINRLVVALLRAVHEAGPAQAGTAVQRELKRQTASSRYWIDDDQLRTILRTAPLYRQLTRPRMRMLLEAVEDSLRGPWGEGQPCPRQLTVEHVMPQQWAEHWGEDVLGDPEAEQAREDHVHVLGNLTLVNDRLNPALSNRPWTDETTAARGINGKGKRSLLLEHSTLKLNALLAVGHEREWTETDIDQRTEELIDHIVRIWPRPEQEGPGTAVVMENTAVGEGHGDADRSAAAVDHHGKYRGLWRWLRDRDGDRIPMDFAQVAEAAGVPLPDSAYNHSPHWYSYEGSALGRAIRDAGWRATKVNLDARTVCFVRFDQEG